MDNIEYFKRSSQLVVDYHELMDKTNDLIISLIKDGTLLSIKPIEIKTSNGHKHKLIEFQIYDNEVYLFIVRNDISELKLYNEFPLDDLLLIVSILVANSNKEI